MSKKKPDINDFKIEWFYVDGKPYVAFIRYAEIARVLGVDGYRAFTQWAAGCTHVAEGFYPIDVEEFIKGYKHPSD